MPERTTIKNFRGAAPVFMVRDVAKSVDYFRMKEFAVQDLDGHVIAFGQHHEPE